MEWRRVAEFERTIEGKAAVRENMDPEIWSEQRAEIRGVEVIGDSLVLDAGFHATGGSSGIQLRNEAFHVWKIKDGMGVRFEAFLDRDEALTAAHEGIQQPASAGPAVHAWRVVRDMRD